MKNKDNIKPSNKKNSKYIGMFKKGQQFGNWTVQSDETFFDQKSRAYISCQCHCGSNQLVAAHHLKNKKSVKCESCNESYDYRGYKNNPNWNGTGFVPKTIMTLAKLEAKNNHVPYSVTPEYVNSTYTSSSGCCMVTGQIISFTDGTARLVRNDLSKGFVPDNITWVHSSVEPFLKKTKTSPNEFIELSLKAAKKHQYKKDIL